MTNTPTPEIGIFDNNGDRPALLFFHYRAGAYEVTLDEPGDFGTSSHVLITFRDDAHAISIILSAPNLFPPLAGLPVEFNADFNDFSPSTPTLTSDGLPTDTSIGRGNFFFYRGASPAPERPASWWRAARSYHFYDCSRARAFD